MRLSTVALGAALAAVTLSPSAVRAASPTAPEDRVGDPLEVVWLHGFRVGYVFANIDNPTVIELPSGEEREITPHLSIMAYEVNQRVDGQGWLNLLFIENFVVAGMNQSLFVPQANFIVGADIEQFFEVGMGVNVSPFDTHGRVIHMVGGMGVTPMVGDLNIPIHFTYVPDVEGVWRVAATIGVTWGDV